MSIRSLGPILAAGFTLMSGAAAAQTWSPATGPTGVTALAVQGNNVFAGTAGGLRRSTDQGATWSSGGLDGWIRDLEVVGSTIYALTIDSLYRSTNGGATWTRLLADSDDHLFSSVAISGNTIFLSNAAPAGKIRRSTDGGRTWSFAARPSCCGTKSLEVSIAGGVVYLAYFEVPNFFSGIARSTNSGASWSRFSTGLPDDMDGYVIAPFGGTVFVAGDQGIYRLASSSSAWSGASAGLGSLDVRDLEPAGTALFAGTAAGVFSSTNNGQSWSDQNAGLTNLSISALAAGGGKLYAANPSGIQSRDLAGSPSGVIDLPVGDAWTRGTITKKGEQDWYRFTVSATAEHVLETALGTLTDTHLSLYGPNSQTTLLAQNDNAEGRASRIRRSLSPGTYYAKVRAAGTSQTGAYRIRARREASKMTVFLIHGLGQGSTAMKSLARNLRNETEGLDKARFVVEETFDWSSCAAANGCAATCTIENGGRALAEHIKQKAPSGDIVLIGYSLGGLISRDMLLRNYDSVVSGRTVRALITLGTPNVGYPYCEIDNNIRCDSLIQQMASHYRLRQDENTVILSDYLYDLAVDWGSSSFPGAPRQWLAVAGTSCQDAVRFCEWNALDDSVNQGCPDNSPASDSVVCQQSALFRLEGLGNKPVEWSNANYRHSSGTLGISVLCSPRGIDLFAPPLASDLFKTIRQTINEIP